MKKSFYLLLGFLLVLVSSSPVYAYPNQPYQWGFNKSKNHVPSDAGPKYESILEKYGSFYLGDTAKKEIYLTFDNGYENGYTADFLDVLKEKEVPATFFVTGHYLQSEPDLIKRMVDEGHIVGSHSWHHPDMTKISDSHFREELNRVEEELEKITGQVGVEYMRPPRGIFSERTLGLAREMGYTNVFWSLAFVDWHTNNQKGWEYAYNSIIEQIHPGAILLLHTVSEDNAKAISKVIDKLREEGYSFRSLDELMIRRHISNPMLFQ